MKIFRIVLLFLVFMGITVPGVLAKDSSPDLCNLCTTYEDELYPLRQYKEGVNRKGRVAVINGCCNGDTSYMTIITYWKDTDSKSVFTNPSIVRLKEVRVSEILENDRNVMYLHGLFTLWYGLDANGNIVSVYKDKSDKMDLPMMVENIFETRVEVWNDPEDQQTARVIDEMQFKSGEWSVPGYEIVADPEWVDYVRPDGSVKLPEGYMEQ